MTRVYCKGWVSGGDNGRRKGGSGAVRVCATRPFAQDDVVVVVVYSSRTLLG